MLVGNYGQLGQLAVMLALVVNKIDRVIALKGNTMDKSNALEMKQKKCYAISMNAQVSKGLNVTCNCLSCCYVNSVKLF